MDQSSPGRPKTRGEIRETLDRLTRLSQEIETLTRSLAYNQDIFVMEKMKKTIDEKTVEQFSIMHEVVGLSANFHAAIRFRTLTSRIESFKDTIKASKNTQDVLQLKDEIDATIDEWSQVWHQIAQDVLRSAPEA